MHIALCDDHALVVEGIALLLKSLDPQVRISPYFSASALLESAPAWSDVDLVLLDLVMPDAEGFQTLQRLRALREDVAVVVLSGQSDRASVLRAIDAGAMGFVPKAATTQTMLEALRIVLAKGVFVPEAALGAVTGRTQGAALSLTARQWEVLHAVLQGKTVKRIARDLDITESTVKTHVSAVLRELDVTTRTEAIVKAMQLGLDFSGANASFGA